MDDGFLLSIEPHRRELIAHCYRMTGSLTEAEDLVQETFLRAWQSRSAFAARSSVRTWLYRIATNASIDALRARKRRSLPHLSTEAPSAGALPLPAPVNEPVWLEPFGDELLPEDKPGPEAIVQQRESVRAAFLVALQKLTPQQRAILLLRDVIGFSADECAALLELSPTAVTSTLARARSEMGDPETGVRRSTAPVNDEQRALLHRYVGAFERRDLTALATLLRDDSVLSMPPFPSWYRGATEICAILDHAVLHHEVRMHPIAMNGTHAFAGWHRFAGSPWQPLGVQLVDLAPDNSGVVAITCFVGADFARFHLAPPAP